MLTASALSRGFSVQDFKNYTVGQIFDVMKEFIPEEERIYKANQNDIDHL